HEPPDPFAKREAKTTEVRCSVQDRQRVPYERPDMEAPCKPVERMDSVCCDPSDDPGDLEQGVARVVVSCADRGGDRVAVVEPAHLRPSREAHKLVSKGHLR